MDREGQKRQHNSPKTWTKKASSHAKVSAEDMDLPRTGDHIATNGGVPVPILLQYHATAPIPTRFRLPDAGPTGADGEFHGARLSRNPKGDLGREADKSWGKRLRQWWTACSLLKNVKRLKETTSLLEEKRAELDINDAVLQGC
ncbi:uncharacterized protein ACWYII_006799 [Salvelinus alpinus]